VAVKVAAGDSTVTGLALTAVVAVPVVAAQPFSELELVVPAILPTRRPIRVKMVGALTVSVRITMAVAAAQAQWERTPLPQTVETAVTGRPALSAVQA
jgi:hypothetical protein